MQNKSSFSPLLILDAAGVVRNLQNMLHAKFSNWQIVIYVYLHDSEIFISQILKVFFCKVYFAGHESFMASAGARAWVDVAPPCSPLQPPNPDTATCSSLESSFSHTLYIVEMHEA